MSAPESVFQKKLAPETTIDKVEGVLEHFNLPPKFVAFVRRHLRLIQLVTILVVVSVVSWSLYSSYRVRTVDQAASALALAMEQDGSTRTAELENVVQQYGSTPSALWAQIELAHYQMRNQEFSEAGNAYAKILGNLKSSHPLYALVLFGLAQAREAEGVYPEATRHYDALKDLQGYEHIGFTAMARLEEMQGNGEQAIAIYNNLLMAMAEKPRFSGMEDEVIARINRIKAQQ
jgi:predicted negative regulator of RcsB-dependent stress response